MPVPLPPITQGFPEPLKLQVLGSCRPVLFVEGEEGSLDAAVYRALYPGWPVIPRGSCDAVLTATAALRNLPALHHENAYGLVDRDHRSDAQLASFLDRGVLASGVAEVENLLLVPGVVRAVSEHLARDAAQDLAAVRAKAFASLREELRSQVNARATFRLRQGLSSFSWAKCRDAGGGRVRPGGRGVPPAHRPG